jgi:predicted CxxxxCH...CXXCH cytochrome family protein
MHATMTAADAKVDHQIQIGFSGTAVLGMSNGQDTSYNGQSTLSGYTYLGTNSTTTSSAGGMTCANTYCHSNGTSIATGAIPVNTSAAWNSGPITCDSCHEYGPGYDLYAPKANSHVRHNFLGCESCHYTTTTDGTTITNTVQHVNGQYDLAPSPTYYRFLTNHPNTFDYVFDTGGGTCSNISCHDGVIATTKRWGGASLTPSSFNFNYTNQGCYGVTITDYAPSCYPPSACIPPYTYNWVFSDGYTYTSSGTSSSVSREFGAPGTHTATVTVISAKGLSGVRTSMPFDLYPPPNVLPTPDFSLSANGLTVTFTDQSFDTDYNYCGHSGPGRVIIDWGPGGWVDYGNILNLTDTPSGQVIGSYTYASPGTYTINYGVYDNVITYPEFTQKTVTVTIP